MTPEQVNTGIIADTFRIALPASLDGPRVRVMLLAIGLQESRFTHREQVGGPARGFWQFERGGGVVGVLNHHSSAKLSARVCEARDVEPTAPAVYARLSTDDILACAFARLLLLTDPKPLPAVGEIDDAWDCYVRNWRPGRPHRRTWDALYLQAQEAVIGDHR